MCGIVGFILDKNTSSINLDVIRKMNSQLERRPQTVRDTGLMNKTEYLAHRRLSIIELSEKGAQPMQSLNKNLIISFNGEIYTIYKLEIKLIKLKMLNGDQILTLKLYWYQLRHLELKKHSKILLECLHLHLLIKIKIN